jgi:ABC-2 type transport system permease protein
MQTTIGTMNDPSIAENWSTFWAMVYKELIVMTRYPVNFVASFVQIFFIVAVFTFAGLTFSETGESSLEISGVVTYGFVLFLFVNDTLWTIGYSVRRDQIEGTLEQLYLSPANKFASLVSRVANLLIWTGLLCIVAVLVMRFLLGGLPLKNPILAFYLLIMSLLGTFGTGFAFAALTLQVKETASTIANFLQFALLIFCAMFFPFSALPEPMLWISRVIPLSYAVDAFRSTLMGFPDGFPELAPIEVEIVFVTIFGLLMPFLGHYLYSKAEIAARRKGSLAEY